MELPQHHAIGNLFLRVAFFIVLNVLLVFVFGFLTLDSWANINSRLAALLLSFFISAFIVFRTSHLSGMNRMIRFGSGLSAYLLVALATIGFSEVVITWLLPCFILYMMLLNFGDALLGKTIPTRS